MKHWKVDQQEWRKKHPYSGPWETFGECEAYCAELRKAHTDKFTPKQRADGWVAEQDIP